MLWLISQNYENIENSYTIFTFVRFFFICFLFQGYKSVVNLTFISALFMFPLWRIHVLLLLLYPLKDSEFLLHILIGCTIYSTAKIREGNHLLYSFSLPYIKWFCKKRHMRL